MVRRKTKIVSLPIADLVEDMELYPRHNVDNAHVQSLTLALESGETLPPVVADMKSKRISDGWHRVRAHRRFAGPDAVTDVELVDYESDDAMFFDAVARNSSHGRRLDVIDQTRSVIMLERHGYTAIKIAKALKVTEKRIEKLRIKVATTESANEDSVPGTKTITLKRPVQHMQGQVLTKRQAEVHGMLPGTSFLLIARQLTEALKENMVDLSDDNLKDHLVILRDQLTASLG